MYEYCYGDKNLFDLSDYPKNLSFYDPVNKIVIGKMKDKVRGNIFNEFVGLKWKMYSLVMVDDKEMKKTKGINKNVVDNVRHKEYTDVFFIKKWWDMIWKEFKVNCIKWEPMMFVKFWW